MEDCPAGDAGPVLNAGGAERPGFRLRQSSAKLRMRTANSKISLLMKK
jgi:hypothetical protein